MFFYVPEEVKKVGSNALFVRGGWCEVGVWRIGVCGVYSVCVCLC